MVVMVMVIVEVCGDGADATVVATCVVSVMVIAMVMTMVVMWW